MDAVLILIIKKDSNYHTQYGFCVSEFCYQNVITINYARVNSLKSHGQLSLSNYFKAGLRSLNENDLND
jgi:hypothetical protein